MLNIISNWIRAGRNKRQFKNCFSVTWDDAWVRVESKPPKRLATVEQFRWKDIEKICMEAKSKCLSDEIYIFTSDRLEAYIIPVEATGGHKLMEMLIIKNLYDANLAKSAMASVEGLYWWPSST